MNAIRRHPLLSFGAAAAAVAALSRVALTSSAFARHPGALAFAVTFDLTVSATALFWLLAVRTGRFGPAAMVPVFCAGAALASLMVPSAQRAWPLRAGLLGEAAVAVALGVRVVRGRRALRAAGRAVPFEDALEAAARAMLGSPRLAAAVASEAALLRFALFSWREAPHLPEGHRPFTGHRSNGLGAVIFALGLVTLAEAVGGHLLLSQWSSRAAWVATGLSLYGLVWLIGDYRAVLLRPVLLGAEALEVRIGLRWRATIPLDAIRQVCDGPDQARHRGAWRASALGQPLLYLHLSRPVEVRGLLGIRRQAEGVGLRVDEAEELRRLLRARGAAPR
jgi:hypothetical protein